MKTLFKAVVSLIVALILVFQARPVRAQTSSPSGSLLMVDKLISTTRFRQGDDINKAQFIDNLSANSYRFFPGDTILFKIKVKNLSSDTKLTDVKLDDTVPAYIEPLSSVTGYNSTARIVTIPVGDLNPQEEKEYILSMQVVPADRINQNEKINCVVNNVRGVASTASDEDSSQFCIENPSAITSVPTASPTPSMSPTPSPTPHVQNVGTIPRTGPEFGIILIILETAGIAAGFALKRKSS